jgi:hypothetical protein
MRFATTFQDTSLRVLGTGYVFLMPVIYFRAPDARFGTRLEHIIAWVVWLMMLIAMLPKYYEVREDGLFLRLRWKSAFIPYASLVELWDQPNRNGLKAEVNLVRVTANTGETYTFGVDEKERFLREVSKRCPHVARTSLPYSAGSIS